MKASCFNQTQSEKWNNSFRAHIFAIMLHSVHHVANRGVSVENVVIRGRIYAFLTSHFDDCTQSMSHSGKKSAEDYYRSRSQITVTLLL